MVVASGSVIVDDMTEHEHAAGQTAEAPESRVRGREKIAEIAGSTDESVCPTLVRKDLRFAGQALPPANRFVFTRPSAAGCASAPSEAQPFWGSRLPGSSAQARNPMGAKIPLSTSIFAGSPIKASGSPAADPFRQPKERGF
jgi:hypothetical protein